MRREAFVTVLLTSVVVFAGHFGYGGDEKAHWRGKPAAHRHHVAVAAVASDTVSGCVRGAALVKVLIDLSLHEDRRCVPEVTPASVCVAPGGIVRFKIENNCPVGDPSRPPIEIGQAEFKRRLDGTKDGAKRPPVFQRCSHQVWQPEDKTSHVVHCDVSENAAPGFYKYGLTGIVSLDPDVEVQPGDQ